MVDGLQDAMLFLDFSEPLTCKQWTWSALYYGPVRSQLSVRAPVCPGADTTLCSVFMCA